MEPYIAPMYKNNLVTVNGCDSVAILNLTITQPDTSHTTITACDSYEWNGETYSESGTYNYSEQNDNEFSMSFGGVMNLIIMLLLLVLLFNYNKNSPFVLGSSNEKS